VDRGDDQGIGYHALIAFGSVDKQVTTPDRQFPEFS
jgi:hypothetical protein